MSCRCATCGHKIKKPAEQDEKAKLRRRLERLRFEQAGLEASLTACLVEQDRIQKALEE